MLINKHVRIISAYTKTGKDDWYVELEIGNEIYKVDITQETLNFLTGDYVSMPLFRKCLKCGKQHDANRENGDYKKYCKDCGGE